MTVIRNTDRVAADGITLHPIIWKPDFFDSGIDDAKEDAAFVVGSLELQRGRLRDVDAGFKARARTNPRAMVCRPARKVGLEGVGWRCDHPSKEDGESVPLHIGVYQAPDFF